MRMKLQEYMDFIRTLVQNGGPDESEYEILDNFFAKFMSHFNQGVFSEKDRQELWQNFGEAFSTQTMQGFAVCKPHGYLGDFEIIDRIYQSWVSPHEHLKKWDYFFHTRQAPRAVRNRKAYFQQLLQQVEANHRNGSIHLLNVGSGPARDVSEYLDQYPHSQIRIDCLDQDQKAIYYAQKLCTDHLDRVFFINENIFHYRPAYSYDLIWSAGLFDYLLDRHFCVILKRLLKKLKPNGELVIGNFSPKNPTRAYMEFACWRLYHRTDQQLRQLAEEAGVPAEYIRVEAEPEKVNLFLHIRNG